MPHAPVDIKCNTLFPTFLEKGTIIKKKKGIKKERKVTRLMYLLVILVKISCRFHSVADGLY